MLKALNPFLRGLVADAPSQGAQENHEPLRLNSVLVAALAANATVLVSLAFTPLSFGAVAMLGLACAALIVCLLVYEQVASGQTQKMERILMVGASVMVVVGGFSSLVMMISAAMLLAGYAFAWIFAARGELVDETAKPEVVQPETAIASQWLDALPGSALQLSRNGDVTAVYGEPLFAKGRALFDAVHVHDRPLFLKMIDDALSLHTKTTARVRVLRGQELRTYEFRFGFLSNDEIFALVRDVTDELQKVAVLEEALHGAQKQSKAKGQFLSVMSHELRTPLNAIIGFAEMIEQAEALKIGPEQYQSYAGIIRNSGEHLLEVVEALLDLAKLESGHFEITPEPFLLDGVFKSVLNMLQLRAEKAGVTLQSSLDPTLGEVSADPRAVRQILINLLSNALKFTPQGGQITLQALKRGNEVVLKVRDNGCGMSAEDVVLLGQPFFQASSGHARKNEGTGLGLAIVKGLLELHQGSFEVESKLGGGTCVSVTLPLKTTMATQTGKPLAEIKPRWSTELEATSSNLKTAGAKKRA